MVFSDFFSNFFYIVLDQIINTSIYWMPVVLVLFVWYLFRFYVEYNYLANLRWNILEIKFPKEVRKSPLAMEVVLSALHQTNEGNLVEHYIDGKVRPWFSLEVASVGGEIKFYVNCCELKFKNLIEAQIYAQYPGVEVVEVEDYTRKMPYGLPGSSWDFFGIEFGLIQPDPYPIKTYISYGLDKDDKEDFKVDPMTPVLELMSALKPGEQMWLQIPIMAAKKRKKPGTFFGRMSWADEGEDIVNDILKRDPATKSSRQMSASGFPIIPTISKEEQETAASIQRNISKLGFDCGMRIAYFAKAEEFNGMNISGMLASIKQYNSPGSNGFEPKLLSKYEYFWEDPFGGVERWRNNNGPRSLVRKAKFFDAMKKRAYFYYPYQQNTFTLSTEELATIFHFPGEVSAAPALGRIESRRGQPPTNLPI